MLNPRTVSRYQSCCGSRTSRRPSPSRLKARLAIRITARRGGNPPLIENDLHSVGDHRPHSAIGGRAPRPRKPSPAAARIMPAIQRQAHDGGRQAQR